VSCTVFREHPYTFTTVKTLLRDANEYRSGRFLYVSAGVGLMMNR
jgi:hypothetical protein